MSGPAARAKRRGRGEGSIYKDEAKGRWYAAVSIGNGPDGKTWRRHKISGRTRAEVAAKLRELQAEQDLGAQPTPGYTVQRAVDDWLAEGMDGRAAGTATLNRYILKSVASDFRCKSAGAVPGFMIRLGDGADSAGAVGRLAGGGRAWAEVAGWFEQGAAQVLQEAQAV
jgi:hypothetical protein